MRRVVKSSSAINTFIVLLHGSWLRILYPMAQVVLKPSMHTTFVIGQGIEGLKVFYGYADVLTGTP